jgi:hypothetical protein
MNVIFTDRFTQILIINLESTLINNRKKRITKRILDFFYTNNAKCNTHTNRISDRLESNKDCAHSRDESPLHTQLRLPPQTPCAPKQNIQKTKTSPYNTKLPVLIVLIVLMSISMHH